MQIIEQTDVDAMILDSKDYACATLYDQKKIKFPKVGSNE